MQRTGALAACLAAAVLLAGCGSATASHPSARRAKRHAAVPSPIDAAFPDPASRACATTLASLGVPVGTLSLPPAAQSPPTWQKVTLASSLGGGPVGADHSQSSIQTAYENVLSGADGYPLTPYLGRTLTEVGLSGGPGGMSGYTCLEQGGKAVGVWGQESGYTAQPEFLVSAKGQTLQSLVGADFLTWLERQGDYEPQAVPNSPAFTAEQALLHYFAVLNDQGLAPAARSALLTTYTATAGQQNAGPSPLLALVPIAITPWNPPAGSGLDQSTQQEFGVQLWPHWRSFPPTGGEMAGNGWQYMFYVMERPQGAALWQVGGAGTGP